MSTGEPGEARIEPSILVAPYGADDDLVAATLDDGRPRVRVRRAGYVAVVLGRASRPEVELRLERCAADGVIVSRRPGGGCAVVNDPGDVVVSATAPQSGLPRIRELFASFSDWLLDALHGLGLADVRREDVSDLARGERKVGGACLYRPRGVVLYTATLLVEPEVALMERYLAHPPREPAYRRGRSHADFVGRLADAPGGWTASRLANALAEALGPPAFLPAAGGAQ